MDVHCSTCHEPWEDYTLRHEEIHETSLAEADVIAWLALPTAQKLSPEYRAAFRALGWEFGNSVVNVICCPCCPAEAQPDPDRVAAKAALESVLGDDTDGLVASFEDYQL
jgi:hypothetical protein